MLFPLQSLEALRPLHVRRRSGGDWSGYVENGFTPGFLADFAPANGGPGVFKKASSDSPITFDEALTFIRSGPATFFDSDGKLKWDAHNLALQADNFANAAWNKQANVSVVGSQVTFASVTNDALFQGIPCIAGAAYTFEMEVQGIAGQTAQISIQHSGGPNVFVPVTFTGSLQVIRAAGAVASVSANANVAFDSDGGNPATVCNIYRARFYRSDLGGMANNPDTGDSYVPTTTVARFLSRRRSHLWNGLNWVNEGILLEGAATNYLNVSQDLSNGVQWLTAGVTVGGGTETVKVTTTAGGGVHVIYTNLVTTTAGATAFAVDVKADGYNFVGISINDGNTGVGQEITQTFNLATGAKATTYNATALSTSIVPLGDGWFRIHVAYDKPTAPGSVGVWPLATDIQPRNTFISDGVSGIQIRHPQLEAGAVPTSYIPTTTTAAVPRVADTLQAPAANLPTIPVVTAAPDIKNIGTTTTTGTTAAPAYNPATGVGSVSRGSGGSHQGVVGFAGLTPGVSYTFDITNDGPNNLSAADVAVGGPSAATFANGRSQVPIVAPAGGVIYIRTVSTNLTQTFTLHSLVNPLATGTGMGPVSLAIEGKMNYADLNVAGQEVMLTWQLDGGNRLHHRLYTGGGTGQFVATQLAAGVTNQVASGVSVYAPGLNLPFSWASRHGPAVINGAYDGILLAADTGPVALANFSASPLQIAPAFNGHVKRIRVWGDDIADAGILAATLPKPTTDIAWSFLDSRDYTLVSGAVSAMRDKSGKGYALTQPTTTKQPVFVPAGSGVPAGATLDDVDDWLINAALGPYLQNAKYVVNWTGIIGTLATDGTLWALNAATGNGWLQTQILTSGRLRVIMRNIANATLLTYDVTTRDLVVGELVTVSVAFHDALMDIYYNGLPIITDRAWDMSAQDVAYANFSVGSRVTGGVTAASPMGGKLVAMSIGML